MCPRAFVLAVAASLSLAFLGSGAPLPGAAGQERAAGVPGVGPPAPSPAGAATHERASRECGLNCVFLLLRLCGHDITYDQTREAVPVGPSGTNLLELQQAASRLGAKTAVSRCSMAELRQMPKPVIAHVQVAPPGRAARPGHYVVVVSADETWISVIDGTFGASFKYPASQFEAEWTGHILTPAPGQTWLRPLALTAVVGLWVGIGLFCWRARVSRRAEAAPTSSDLGQAEGARS